MVIMGLCTGYEYISRISDMSCVSYHATGMLISDTEKGGLICAMRLSASLCYIQ